MKEVMAIIRSNKVNKTKESLAEAGFPSFTCRKVLGRGKKSIDITLIESLLMQVEVPVSPMAENISEVGRLIPKRLFTLIVKDEDVKKVVDTIINVNSQGNPGDGKIFIIPINEAYRIRNEEAGDEAI
ncbi:MULTISPECIES: P-II family nitrogen regulator [Clostridium]|uniref:P-II family nitrogen regulator n=1 Tax=Clostridium paridis TaxID=2803863 RepID=A0A937FE08_9CLOT|nr:MULTISPECIES: P-II family nitrogen regulator [Clostridium]MBL4931564.1 P-II family nitrogen regulator [Clostridium paridis]MDD7795631.1 P-II family nitrogen regulator [Clostridium sp. 'White wine YQ']